MATIINATTGSAGGVVITPDTSGIIQIQSNGVNTNVQAWGSFNGNGGVSTNASYNVSSITRGGGGTYTVNFTNSLIDGNYAAVCTTGTLTNSTKTLTPYTPSSSSFSIQTLNTSYSAQDSYWVSFAVFR
jgi:hypothetical protein